MMPKMYGIQLLLLLVTRFTVEMKLLFFLREKNVELQGIK